MYFKTSRRTDSEVDELSEKFKALLQEQTKALGFYDPRTLLTSWKFGNHLRRSSNNTGLAKDKLVSAILGYQEIGVVESHHAVACQENAQESDMYQTDMYHAIACLGQLYASMKRTDLAEQALENCQKAMLFFTNDKADDSDAYATALELTRYIGKLKGTAGIHSAEVSMALLVFPDADGTPQQREDALRTILEYRDGTTQQHQRALDELLEYEMDPDHEQAVRERADALQNQVGIEQREVAAQRSWTALVRGVLPRYLVPR